MTLWGVCQADYLFVCFGTKPKQRPELEISDETRSGGRKEGPRKARGAVGEKRCREAIDNGGQRRAVSFELTVQRMTESTEERWLLKPDELRRGRLTNVRRCQPCWCLFVEVSCKIHAVDSLQMHGECKVS